MSSQDAESNRRGRKEEEGCSDGAEALSARMAGWSMARGIAAIVDPLVAGQGGSE